MNAIPRMDDSLICRLLNVRIIGAGRLPKEDLQTIDDAIEAIKSVTQPSEVEKLMDAAGLCRRCAAPKHEQLPPNYMLAKLQMVMPLMQEARDALTAISVEQMKLRGISATLAERMDEAGTFSLDNWLALQAIY
ncbi:MAG TPA: hypothetical protein DCY64_22770 [Hydrogenophaga sp.]|uniref:hypothetical protein n=1 Tax=Hydrogenophaga sp. TaxID=1904254 RepID=UPI0008C156F3|nr:hypothetical protein [Hydrogenophaga sp.]OGA78810.1 MAG: hypothetical protein A2X73_07610 [Burkholderiales bacterium GWE1_65_30]OGA89381.1 MAG: hypothetical protein A2X72_16770 [Burkholderiales bacterium GWF1_66_17]HAX23096.1 hypothetical protein [Hydrogenophaga sp.]HBU17039.1 hypothetical protein [Hydrogenophaga sp.]